MSLKKIQKLVCEIVPAEMITRDSREMTIKLNTVIDNKVEILGVKKLLDSNCLVSEFDAVFDLCRELLRGAIEGK